jgi:hypothetical protein
MTMRKTIYFSGILSSNLIMFGSLFLIMHWPGANILLSCGCLLFCFFFLPIALMNSYKEREKNKYMVLHIVTFIVFSISVLSILFTIEHWPYSKTLLMISLPLPFVLFLPVYIYEMRKENKTNSTYIPLMFGLVFIAVFSVLLTLK